MNCTKLKWILSMALLNAWLFAPRLAAGEASGGGTPEVSLVDCQDAVYVGAPIGQETTRIRATVVAKALTSEPVGKSVDFALTDDRVHFFGKGEGEAFHLRLATKPENGSFLGTLTLGQKTVEVACSRLDERFRPLPERSIETELLYGGKKCFGNRGCVGFVGGLLPDKRSVPLKFNVKHGRLEGGWQIEKEAFGQTVVFDLSITRRRNRPYVHELKISRKDDPNPTILVSEGLHQNIRLQTPALPLGADTLEVWQKTKINVGTDPSETEVE